MLVDPRSNPDLRLTAPLARMHPVAKLAACTIIAAGLILSVDVVSAGVALLGELLALPWCGVRAKALLRRCAVLIIGAVPAGVSALLFGSGPPSSGLAVALRILAIGLPGVVLLSTTDPTDLADGLAQVLRLPARFTLSALAALRLFGVLAQEWRILSLARRARGLGGGGPLTRLRLATGQVFALLVLAIRRGATLATAMEARGFGTDRPRTWARPSRLRPQDGLLVLGSFGLTVVAIGLAVHLGSWRLILL